MPADLVRELVSSRMGLIRSIAPQARGRGEPRPPYLYTATLAHFDYRRADASERVGAGKGMTKQGAIASAVGEAVERYCAYQGDPRRLDLAPWSAVAPAAISPADLVLYSDEQYSRPGWPYARWSEELALPWVQGVELPSGVAVAVPAGLTYLASDSQPCLAPATSNGLAAGATHADAVLGALCEVMERDAFLITWMNRLPTIQLDLAGSGPFPAGFGRHFARRNVEVRAFVLPSDVPATTVLALCLDDDQTMPAQVVGLGCHPDPGVALTKALLEVAQSRPAEAHRFREKPPAGRLARYQDVGSLEDHSAFAGQRARRPEFDFLFDTSTAPVVASDLANRSTGDAAGDVDACTQALADAGHRVAVVDLTLPDVAQVGLHVVRALVTDLQPIHFGYGQERLGGSRLTTAAQRLGFSDRVAAPADLNPCPHPLA